MAQAAEKIIEFPAGGIADFYMEDDEIEALEREEAKKAFGDNGIANFSDVANRMASYGRGGDDTLAHVATGEIVIPLPLIANNPEMKASIFKHLEELGVEDPEQYVVGSSANSINPETGLREFGWLKKAVKKITRGVKKAVKSVVKVVKKAAPIIIPLVLNYAFPGLGNIYSGALGSGIGTLVQGGSLKDAFKSALVGGAIGGAISGVQGAMAAKTAGTSMTQGAIDGIKGAARLSNLTTAGQQLATGQFGQAGYDAVTAAKAAAGDQMFAGLGDAPPPSPSQELSAATDIRQPYGGGIQNEMVGGPQAFAEPTTIAGTDIVNQGQSVDLLAAQQGGLPMSPDMQLANISSVDGTFTGADAALADTTGAQLSSAPGTFANVPEAPGFFESLQDVYTPGGRGPLESLGDAFFPSGPSPQDILTANNMPATAENLKAAAEVAKASAPGFMRTVLPSTAVGLGVTTALGGFDKPDDDPPPDPPPPIKQGPEYMVGGLDPRGSTGPIVVGTDYGIDPRTGRPYVNPFRRPVYGRPATVGHLAQLAAEGGEIFPRRVGGIMPNEGIPGKDSVRAMLMPGEFVMTTDAVKGLGNGNNDQGINRMYDMMRGLEAKGRAMA